MPISGASSYPSTVDEFLSHWEGALTAVAEGVTLGATTREDLVTSQDDLELARDAVTDLGVDRGLARETLTAQIVALQGRMVEFNARVRGDLPESIFVNTLPTAFAVGEAEDAVRDGLRKISRLWTKINALSPAPAGVALPYKLAGDYTLAMFNTAREALRDAYRALSDAEVDLGLARATRNKVQDVIYPILKSYRQKITGLATTHPELVATLPKLTPEPGRTPSAVPPHATWEAASAQAKVTWPASSDADLEKFEVRGVPGDSYNTDDEVVLATVLPGGPREFLTDFGLTAAGLTAGFKVYVMLTTGNEKGSDPVYVTRPG